MRLWLAFFQFLDAYLAPNDLRAWPISTNRCRATGWARRAPSVVRRPRRTLLAMTGTPARRQRQVHGVSGRLGVLRLAWGAGTGKDHPGPEQLTREDFRHEKNTEVRRVIQERMGQRFVPELGGVVHGQQPRGILYEVRCRG